MRKNFQTFFCLILVTFFFASLSMGAGKTILADALPYTITNEVIVDNEACTFKITKAEIDPIWGFSLKVFCENKTSDKTLMFSITEAIVNGYMVDPFWAKEVAPGKKSNETISFSSTDFKDIGITSANEIIFTLRVYDSNDWMAENVVNDSFTIYPTGLSADAIQYPERKTSPTEQVIIDNDDICFVILGTEIDKIWGYTINCFIENKTDKTLMFSWDDVSVNGYMIDPYWVEEVAPNARSYDEIHFLPDKFTENDISTVEEIEFSMRVYDSNDWMADNVYLETLTYKPVN